MYVCIPCSQLHKLIDWLTLIMEDVVVCVCVSKGLALEETIVSYTQLILVDFN